MPHPSVAFHCVAFNDLTPRALYDALQLRTEVFIVEQNCPYQDADGLDPFALHVLGYGQPPSGAADLDMDPSSEPVLLCYARLLPQGTSYANHAAIGRVITKPTVRGTGLGRTLMLEAIRRVNEAWNTPPLRLGAQDYAIPFYEGLGFRSIEHRYVEDGIPHTTMERIRATTD